ncbi:hypothetical protein HK096_007723, partial [Nowakowskiella sp. JEL0078]
LNDIVSHCQSFYSPTLISENKYKDTDSQVSNFAVQGIAALAYQLHNGGVAIREFCDALLLEIDDQAIQVDSISRKIQDIEDLRKQRCMDDLLSHSRPSRTLRILKLEVPLIRFIPTSNIIDLNLFDSIGTLPRPVDQPHDFHRNLSDSRANSTRRRLSSQLHKSQNYQNPQFFSSPSVVGSYGLPPALMPSLEKSIIGQSLFESPSTSKYLFLMLKNLI